MKYKIVSLNIGRSEALRDYHQQSFSSAIRKIPISAAVLLSKNGLSGDYSHEPFHGGKQRALHVFCHENYAFYNDKAGYQLPIPAFGENLTVAGYDESIANVGDVLRIGEAVVQVSHPTERCAKIGKSLGLPKMLKWVHEELRTGYYFRVLEEGKISIASNLELLETGPAHLNVAALNRLLFKQPDRAEMDRVLLSPLLSPQWKTRARELYQRTGL
ncbi:MAG: MOSC domain-containing protein [Arenicella sp.]|nr:MOSC domain-containing protein [Arenicella sp.]